MEDHIPRMLCRFGYFTGSEAILRPTKIKLTAMVYKNTAPPHPVHQSTNVQMVYNPARLICFNGHDGWMQVEQVKWDTPINKSVKGIDGLSTIGPSAFADRCHCFERWNHNSICNIPDVYVHYMDKL